MTAVGLLPPALAATPGARFCAAGPASSPRAGSQSPGERVRPLAPHLWGRIRSRGPSRTPRFWPQLISPLSPPSTPRHPAGRFRGSRRDRPFWPRGRSFEEGVSAGPAVAEIRAITRTR